MEMGQVCLHRGEEQDIASGSLWIYDNEIDWCDDRCHNGDVVEVIDNRHRFVAYGFFNAQSKIAVRILSRQQDKAIDQAFFRKRIAAAWAYRQQLGFDNACRVIFGESDGLPGLTVDKFGDYLSFQIVSLGMEQRKQMLIDLLVECFQPRGIYERNDLVVREKEGMPQQTGCVYGEVPSKVIIREHDAQMAVCIPTGQKTGHFLDQQENRGHLRPYVPGKTVLDLCCCSGGFSIHAALYGAASVESVDVSAQALALVQENAALNQVTDRIHTVQANVFDLARQYADAGKKFGVVICDPPAFAKSRQALDGAFRGYKELNLRCMQMVEPGGFLVTCSCSHFMTPPLFLQMLQQAAADSKRTVRLVETLLQSRDHPAALNAGQSLYLKGHILQIL